MSAIKRRAFATALSHATGIAAVLFMTSCATPEPPEFVGVSHWTHFDRGADPVHLDDPTGHAEVWIDHLPAHGATSFPVGTHIVRAMGEGDDPTTWEAHGLVKVGGDFNADGAVGWEYCGLDASRDASGDLAFATRWHGVGPPDGDGYAHAGDAGPVLGCNHCHGAATWNDSILGPELTLSDF
jgi:hypothetical protein